ncbi:MAG: hypothetical protein IJV01_00775 [Bacteroidales bacterium]|nr:hypothetical protein [Bacteroidales bacterium]
MKRILKLVGPALAALLLVSFSSPVQAAPAAQDAVGEIIAAYLSGGAGFAAADPEAAARARSFEAAIAQALDAYKENATQDNWSNLRSEVEKAVRTAISIHRVALFNNIEKGDAGAEELFAILSKPGALRNATEALTAGDGLYAHIDRSIVFGNDPATNWKPRKKSASAAVARLLEGGDTAAAKKQFVKLYKDMAVAQTDRFDAFGQEVNDLIDVLVEEICQ